MQASNDPVTITGAGLVVSESPQLSGSVRASNRHLEGHGFDSRLEDSEFFLSIRLESVMSFFSFASKSSFHLSYSI